MSEPTQELADSKHEHPGDALEAVYTIAFLFVLVFYGTIAVKAGIARLTLVPLLASCLVLFGFVFHLARMYGVLHDIESPHEEMCFVRDLKGRDATIERLLRLSMASTLIVMPKLLDDSGALLPGVVATCLFLLLLVWDIVVFRSIKNDGRIAASACKFFYYLNEHDFRSSCVPWKRNLERTAGLVAAVFYVWVMGFDGNLDLIYVAAFFMLLFLVAAYVFTQKTLNVDGPKWALGLFTRPSLTLMSFVRRTDLVQNSKERKPLDSVISFLVLLSFVGYAACSPDQRERGPGDVVTSATLDTISIATSKNIWCALTLVADEKGFFASEGLHVELSYQAAGRLNMEQLVGRKVDLANVVETNLAYQALRGDSTLHVVSVIAVSGEYAITRKLGPRTRQGGPLRGSRIAYAQATGAESFLFFKLEQEGLDAKDVTLIPLQPVAVVERFGASDADAAVTWEPFTSTISRRFPELAASPERDTSSQFRGIMTLTTSQKFASQRPATLDALRRAYQRASQFTRDSTEAVVKILSDATTIAPNDVRQVLPLVELDASAPDSSTLRIVREVLSRIQRFVPDLQSSQPVDVVKYMSGTVVLSK